MSEQGGGGGSRYLRQNTGFVGALVITVIAVAAFVGYRSLFTRDYVDRPENVDYLQAVADVQDAGFPMIYPPALPPGWIARAVDVDLGERPEMAIALLTDAERFVGVRVADDDVEDLLTTYVDPDAEEGRPFSVSDAVAPRWQTWSDADGDHALTASVDDLSVMVFGSAPLSDLEAVVASLTDVPVRRVAPTVTSSADPTSG